MSSLKSEGVSKVLVGVCTDQMLADSFPKQVYLFPAGTSHYYVSRFPNKNAHMGCFQASRFEPITEDSWPAEPPKTSIQLIEGQAYRAELIWKREDYNRELGTYYVKSVDAGENIFFFKNADLTDLCGCFPQHWFTKFKLVDEVVFEEVAVEIQEEPNSFEQLSLF